jgi:ribosomal protein S18 acetylase RimI-like enzyme
VEIVPCKPEHYADCARIAVQVWEDIHEAYIEYQGRELHDAFSSKWRTSKEREVIEQQGWPGAFVALIDGKVAGFCGYRIANGNLGLLGYNGVDPAYRGNGIARYLYEACFEHMRQQGLTCTRVYTGMDNGHAPARRAYEKVGYDKRVHTMTYYLTL